MSEQKVIAFEQISVACRNCGLAPLCLPVGLDPEDVERLNSIIRRNRPLHRGDHLFLQGEALSSVYVVKTGTVTTYAPCEDGSEKILGFHLPGELVGLGAIQKEAHCCSARALEISAVCEVPFNRLEELSAAIPSLQHQMYRLLSKEIADETETLMLLGKKSAEERLASFLLSLSERFKVRGFSPTDFFLSMSRHEIGSYLGLAEETVSRLISRFQEIGLLQAERKHIQLTDMEGLQAMAGRIRSGGVQQRIR